MIITPKELKLARQAWIARGGHTQIFDDAAAALHAAISQADVIVSLAYPAFLIRKRPVVSIWDIESGGNFVIAYEIFEYSTYADVEIR